MSAVSSEPPSAKAPAPPPGGGERSTLLEAALVRLLNPLVSIELAASFRRKRFLAAFSITMLLVVAILIITLVANLGEALLYPAKIGQAVFAAFTVTLLIAMSILFPAFASASIVEERVNRSLDLLLTTRMSPWEIFFGKWSATFVYNATYLAGTLPVVGLAFLLGGVEPQALVTLAVLALAMSAAIASIGTFASAATGTLLRAVLASYFLSNLFGCGLGLVTVPVFIRHLSVSSGLYDASVLTEFEQLFAQGSDLIYAGTALCYIAVTVFFAIVGINRLAPPAHDRSTRVRGFTAALAASLGVLLALAVRRYAVLAGGDGTVAFYALGMGVIAALVLFAALIFSTESREISRRVRAEVARRFAGSPLRLLAPGPSRGAAFAIILSLLLMVGLGLDARLGMGIGDAGNPNPVPRGDLALPALAWMIVAFTAFVAALGRLMAVRATGAVLPRVIVAAAGLLAIFAPLVSYAVELQGQRHSRLPVARKVFPSSSLTGGYFLSPVLAGFSCFEVNDEPERRGAYYLFPERLDRMPGEHVSEDGEKTLVPDDGDYVLEAPALAPGAAAATATAAPAVPTPTAAAAAAATPTAAAPPVRPLPGMGGTIAPSGPPAPVKKLLPFSERTSCAVESSAFPLHRVTTWFYAGLAALLWVLASILERAAAPPEGAS